MRLVGMLMRVVWGKDMTWIIDQLIAFLADLRSAPLLAQFITLAGIPGIVIGYPVWVMNRKVRATVTSYEELEQRLATAHRVAARLETERAALYDKTPESFLEHHAREMKDDNEESAMALAEDFLNRQKEALLLAFRTRMDEAIRQSVEDGAPAFAAARSWALAALALAPDDRMLRMLIDELAEAEAIAASGARMKLKGEADRKARAAREDRLPTDLSALADAFFAARDRGHYELMLFLAGHGLMVTRRRPFGAGSREHLLFRRHRCEALNFVGRSREALAEADPLGMDFTDVFGDRAEETFYIRHLIAKCRRDTGDAAGALTELEALLPLRTDVQGARHPGVLVTRYLIAQCRRDTGDAAGALTELEALLPLRTDVQGARDPGVLVTRHLIAQCRKDTGDAAGALTELEDLLPLYTDVQGARHPDVLVTRCLIAQCRRELGDAAGALTELEDLLPLYTDVQGARHPHVLATRHLIAQCRRELGDAAGALTELKDLLPLYIDVQGARHPDVLATRHLIVQCRSDMGDAAGALTELKDLLPPSTDVLGARHPDVLATRHLIAQCWRDTGDAAGALTELKDLLPLYTDVQGARHPDVLVTRTLRAACLLDMDDSAGAAAEIEGVREALVAAGLRPEHRYFKRLEEVEKRLRESAGD